MLLYILLLSVQKENKQLQRGPSCLLGCLSHSWSLVEQLGHYTMILNSLLGRNNLLQLLLQQIKVNPIQHLQPLNLNFWDCSSFLEMPCTPFLPAASQLDTGSWESNCFCEIRQKAKKGIYLRGKHWSVTCFLRTLVLTHWRVLTDYSSCTLIDGL